MMAKIYKGFSTKQYEDFGGTFEIYDIDCVKEDLMNDLMTIIGQRLKMPNEGTRIPIMSFEINDLESMHVVEEDLKKVINNDPRVDLLAISILPAPEKNVLIAVLKISYKEFNVTEDLRIRFNSK